MSDQDFDKRIVELLFEWRAECACHSEKLSCILEEIVNLMTVGIRDKVFVAVAAAVTPDALAEAIKKLGTPLPAPGPATPEFPVSPVMPALPSVEYRSQWDSDAAKYTSDCGPACVGMLLAYKGVQVTIDDLSVACGMGPGKKYTTPGDLLSVAKRYGVSLGVVTGWGLDQYAMRTPCIALIHYDDIPDRLDKNYTAGHWVVLLGVRDGRAIFHDPDWYGNRRDEGASRSVEVGVFEKAIADCKLDGNQSGYGLVLA